MNKIIINTKKNNNLFSYYRSAKFLKKIELFTVLIIIIAISILLFSFVFVPARSVKIYVDGNLYASYNINYDKTIEISNVDRTNKIVIFDKKISMKYSNCINQICVHSAPISKGNQRIICTPNKVIIVISSKNISVDGTTGVNYES